MNFQIEFRIVNSSHIPLPHTLWAIYPPPYRGGGGDSCPGEILPGKILPGTNSVPSLKKPEKIVPGLKKGGEKVCPEPSEIFVSIYPLQI